MITTVCLKDVLVEGAKEVFETMVFMAVQEQDESASPIPPAGGASEPALLSTITFTGRLEGCLGFCCRQSCARTIAASMLGLEAPDSLGDRDISDALGEIANMVLGAVKSRIQSQVGSIEVSIPSVVEGRELRNSLGEGVEQVRIRMSIEEEHLAELSLLYREGRR